MGNDIWTGWTCPKCGRVWAPWIRQCTCTDISDQPRANIPPINSTYGYAYSYTHECCKNCNNNPSVNPNASGMCNCVLPALEASSVTNGNLGNYTTVYWEGVF